MSWGFERFSSFLIDRLAQSMPGLDAQLKMAPVDRLPDSLLKADFPEAKPSSVVLLVFPEQLQPKMVLIERNTYRGVHSGQMGLPGGKVDINDEGLEHTALRELKEELGIEREKIQIVGKLTPLYIPVSKFMVHPFVGLLKESPQFKPDPRELAGYITIHPSELIDARNQKLSKVNLGEGLSKTVPSYHLGDKVIWGATAMILGEFSELIKPFFSNNNSNSAH